MQAPASLGSWLRDASWLRGLVLGPGGALALALVEFPYVAHLGPSGIVTALVLLFTLGSSLALLVGAFHALANQWPRRLPRALCRATPALVVAHPVFRRLFDGAFAASLPGADVLPFVAPWLVFFATAFILDRLERPSVLHRIARKTRGRTSVFVVASAAMGLELVNRAVRRSEYADVHGGLLVVTVLLAGLALWLSIRTKVPLELHGSRVGVFLTFLWCAGGHASLFLLGDDPRIRWATAEMGTHTRLAARMGRALWDLDRDGHASVLGGGDCAPFDAHISPSAEEIAGNDIDEDCDGTAPSTLTVAAALPERIAELERLRAEPAVRTLVQSTQTMNVVLIVIDALRADALRDRSELPGFQRLLREAVVYRRAFAPAAGTDLSLAGLFTGRINPFVPLDTHLSESYARAGYQTLAVIPSEVLRYVGKEILTRGIATYRRLLTDRFEQDVGSYTTAPRTTTLGLELIDEARRPPPVDPTAAAFAQVPSPPPFFLWLHYFDVHEHREVSAADRRLRALLGEGFAFDSPAARYRALVRLVDASLLELHEGLVARGLWDRTIVAIVSDHGESLGEDPRLPDTHGRFLYNPLIHVPLALRIPGVQGKEVEHPVSILDLHPTLLDLLDRSTPQRADARTLLPDLMEQASPELVDAPRLLPLHESDQRGVLAWPYKLMIRPAENLVELYDLSSDFAERHDLSITRPDLVAHLTRSLHALPTVEVDRTARGRWKREHDARPRSETTAVAP